MREWAALPLPPPPLGAAAVARRKLPPTAARCQYWFQGSAGTPAVERALRLRLSRSAAAVAAAALAASASICFYKGEG